MLNQLRKLKKTFINKIPGVRSRCYETFGFPKLPYFCPVCQLHIKEWMPLVRSVGEGKFRTENEKRICPNCYSFERTRHIRLYFEKIDIFNKYHSFLHVSPEPMLTTWLRKGVKKYVSIDIEGSHVDRNEDLTNLTFQDGSFDIVYCSNVLEHIPEDASAMKEMYRVLEPGGLAIIQVPIKGEVTYEDPSIVSKEERAREFGQADHVRWYGTDIKDRLQNAGFEVKPVTMLDLLELSEDTLRKMNLNRRELLFFCSKPQV